MGTRVPGIQGIITDGENGLLSEIGAVSLRETIQRMLDDAALRERLGKAGRQYVQTHFALERVVELEMALLNRLAG